MYMRVTDAVSIIAKSPISVRRVVLLLLRESTMAITASKITTIVAMVYFFIKILLLFENRICLM